MSRSDRPRGRVNFENCIISNAGEHNVVFDGDPGIDVNFNGTQIFGAAKDNIHYKNPQAELNEMMEKVPPEKREGVLSTIRQMAIAAGGGLTVEAIKAIIAGAIT